MKTELVHALVFVLASVTLFLYGLQGFTKEIQAITDGSLRKALTFATRNRFVAAGFGAIATAVLQSSSAVSTIVVALADSGVLSLKAVMGVLIGANIGTSSTAFLVSFKVSGLGPIFIVLGSFLSLMPIRLRLIGKATFYFGFIFFALDQINLALKPFYQEEFVLEWLSYADQPILGVLAGMVLTGLLQSSSVLTGLVVILADQGVISLGGAVAVVFGANVGTTTTALIASLGMGRTARTAAVANSVFNVVGVILSFPLIHWIASVSGDLGNGSTGRAVAYAHLLFNCGLSVIFLALLKPTHDWLLRYLARRLSQWSSTINPPSKP